MKPRVIPALLLRNGGLVKTVRFKDPIYVGDPINAVRIFNEKQVDEVAFLDITATVDGRGPDFDLLANIVSEAFMPFGYGGGITSMGQVERLFALGIEKVILNTATFRTPELVTLAAEIAGNQSVVASIDVRRRMFRGSKVWVESATVSTGRDPVAYAREMEERGAGEILLNSVDRDGTRTGFDLELVEAVSRAVSIPVIALGGAAELEDFRRAVHHGASAVAAGSMFVFHGKRRAVLITYPDYDRLDQFLDSEAGVPSNRS